MLYLYVCYRISCISYSENLNAQNLVLYALCRLAAAAEGRGPKIIARLEESSEEEDEDEELTPEERGRHKLVVSIHIHTHK